MPEVWLGARPWSPSSSCDGGALSEEPDAVVVVMPPVSSCSTSRDFTRR